MKVIKYKMDALMEENNKLKDKNINTSIVGNDFFNAILYNCCFYFANVFNST